ncbi:uncharacterized protein Nmlp_1688 [Natronomonas moolapensis 8.8.11]|uniref:Uncharacterized protein n=1 Tax=Natronomonas moolapensis (strain DSM 18674 / CECT 7526 / JCM 14361 / 8.8.11) TaxID=268739 RepID=M1XPB9_NATM8|nr:hypothetical protein [Natronomonas moolapensis]CCQ35883.1 uncharacterized protein Nmlp_1688 [Natronomonas moolapensis 8.8.11]
MRQTLLSLAALVALVLFSGVAAAEAGDPTELVPFLEELINSLQNLLDMITAT